MSSNRMRILSTEGVVESDLPNPYDRSLVGGHWSAIGVWSRTGRAERLWDFHEEEVGDGILLEGDWARVEEWWYFGELDFLEVYVT